MRTPRILLVEDDESLRTVVTDALEREGWERFRRHAAESVRLIRHKLFGEPLTG